MPLFESEVLTQIQQFVGGKDDEVSIAVMRLLNPVEVCAECGKTNDWAIGQTCDCWSEVTVDDLENAGLGLQPRGSEEMLLGTVTVTKSLAADDIRLNITWENPEGEPLAVIDAVGMLEMGKDMILNPPAGDDE